jgi:hypothetical protein
METRTRSPRLGSTIPAEECESSLERPALQMLRPSQYEEERRDYALKLITFDKIFASTVSKRVKINDDDEGITREELMR